MRSQSTHRAAYRAALRSRIPLFALLALLSAAPRALAKDPTFQWLYGGLSHDIFYGMVTTADGGYLMVGVSGSFVGTDNDLYVVRTDACGVLQWSATYDIGNGTHDEARKVVRGHDGGYVIVGSTQRSQSCCATGYDPFVMKIDDAGSVVWLKSYPGLNDDYGYDIARYGSSEYVIAGSTASFGAGQVDGFLMRIDLTGAPLYARAYGGGAFDELSTVAVAANGEIIAAGSSSSYTSDGYQQIYVLRTAADLTPIWSNHYGADSADEAANDIVAMSDGTISILGKAVARTPTSDEHPYLLKVASDGKCICDAAYVHADTNRGELTEGVELPNGNLAVTGFYFNQPFGLGRFDVLLMQIDKSCGKVWAWEYGGAWRDQGRALVPVYSVGVIMPTGYVIAGSTNTWTNGGSDDAYLIRGDRNGISGCNEYKTVIAQHSPGFCAKPAPTCANLFAVACNASVTPIYNEESELLCRECPLTLNQNGGDLLSSRGVDGAGHAPRARVVTFARGSER